MQPGDDLKAHGDDQVVTGKISKVSKRSISIESTSGEKKTLQLAPETTITIDGQDAKRTQLKEGQEVRASFSEVSGKNVAVEVRVGAGSSSTGSSTGSTSMGSSSASGSSSTGTSSDTSTGSSTGTSTTEEAKPENTSPGARDESGKGSTSGDTGTRSPNQK